MSAQMSLVDEPGRKPLLEHLLVHVDVGRPQPFVGDVVEAPRDVAFQ